ncbi:NAD-dependent epimerase/dehydratase family protein [Streptococcus uberis]|uniref:NAD-dependent epimerase/dehydratase family protein n=1 Tax=Streptococcus uberis TaxID=1349 RepID=UPI0020BDD1F7|nr:NAD(P)-dependent oxidoreductase [Streptococcus uberis]MCK1208887.1 NAD(P)-dependent oxidoreductase [Streptococcus uberis]MCK1243679.1 NAD(P)-dependent oxidoreductase [Streptococcus uberis]MCK1246013.1 NAD(P)-dependent oxidoreductase [Streptococcus uberis]MCK1247261.1 NAD(P)-dependent oxidoreductase [Streptococcus uberis]MCK1257694.1 NAD(P)-dependent oxidoreductase [Streptococcus uberis]
MKILVTGANGYLGKGVVKELLDKGYQVIATDFKSNYIDSRATIFEEDLFKIDNPFEHFGKPDILIHMAWRDGFVHNSINHINDLPLHYNFIENLIKSGLKHVTVLGSMHEVGFYEGAITENTPTHPQSLYGISKDALRNAIELLCKQNSVIFQWLRGFYIVGNTKDGSSIFSKIIQANLDGKTEFPFTLGLNQFDFLNYDEFCEAVALTSVQSKINGIINICSGRPEKLADRVERFIKENNLNLKLIYGAFPDRPYDSKAVWGSDLKLSQIKQNFKNNEQ